MMSKRDYALGIDTATDYLALALWQDGGSHLHTSPKVKREHAQQLLPTLERLLNEAGVRRAQLASIGVGIGPGSYTGLRVGVSSAKGLARALQLPLYGVVSLDALAHARVVAPRLEPLEPGYSGKLLVGIDARRSLYYAACYQHSAEGLNRVSPILKQSSEQLTTHFGVPLHSGHAPHAGIIARYAHQHHQQHSPVKPLTLLYL